MSGPPLGAGGEFDRIRAIAAALGPTAGAIGDDTAQIPDGAGTLVVSVDASVEHVHFEQDWLTHEEIGWRAAASALSDLAAAAAIPVGLVVVVAVPRDAPHPAVVDIMRGVGAAASSVGVQVLGGDLTAASEWSIVVTVFGRATHLLSRAGATPGDGLWVTGALGGARAALESWRVGAEPAATARRAFAHPEPRIAAAQWLAGHGATAMMDLSDGLGGDAQHLAAASCVHLDIDLGALPLHSAVVGAAFAAAEAAPVFAAAAGEDYELLVTLPAGFHETGEFQRQCGLALTRIGSVVAGRGVQASLNGHVQAMHGFRHQL